MIIIESVQLENIEFSQTYLHSIEQRMLAEVEVQKLQQKRRARESAGANHGDAGHRQGQRGPRRGAGQRRSHRLNGEAKASNIRITGRCRSRAIEARAKALGTNPNLVTLVQAERWNGVLPTTMVPGSAVPFVSIK